IIDEDAAHGARGDGEKLRAIGPLRARLVDQPQVGLVNQCGGAERVVGALAPELVVGDAAQLFVDDGEQPIHGAGVAGPPGKEQIGDVRGGAHLVALHAVGPSGLTWRPPHPRATAGAGVRFRHATARQPRMRHQLRGSTMTRYVLLLATAALLIGCDGDQALAPESRSTVGSGQGPAPAAPSNANAVAASYSRIDVSWQDHASNETGFEVHRSTTGPGGSFAFEASL